MSTRTITLDDRLHQYVLDVSLRESEMLRRLRAETALLPEANMQISPEQGQFMALLVALIGAKRIVEVGTFTGYSALVMAQAMSEDGCLVALDVSEAWTAIAQRYWAEAGVQDRIELTLGPAVETLDALVANGEVGRYDLAFIDADKENYANYYERVLVLVRPGGLICIDNTLWGGKVVDADARDAETQAIRALNAALKNDERVDLSLVPIGDGLTLARKRG